MYYLAVEVELELTTREILLTWSELLAWTLFPARDWN